MNQFTPVLIWCAVQVTVVSAAAACCYAAVRRSSPALRSVVASTSLALIVLLSLLSFSPWPSWRSWFEGGSRQAAIISDDRPASAPVADSAAFDQAPAPRTEVSGDAGFWNHALGVVWEEMQRARQYEPAAGASPPTWRMWLAGLFALGVGLTGIRLVLGLYSVRAYRTRSRPIADAELLELADVLRAELGCRAEVEIRESAALATAATIGWRRPVILLPAEWRSWNDVQRRVVLAHELAHIERHDYAAWLCAQLGLLLHFYHPLVHWLVGKLRLDQELAADAIAAQLSGGRGAYLKTLAEMALQQPNRSLGWPAQSFLPTRRTFLRRIEMLRDSNQSATSAPAALRIVAVAAVLLAAAFAVGLRGPAPFGEGVSSAQQAGGQNANAARGGSPQSSAPFGLAYIPRDALAAVALRPAAIIKRPAAKPIADALRKDDIVNDHFGVSIGQIELATVVVMQQNDGETGGAGLILRLSDKAAAQSVIAKLFAGSEKVKYGPYSYLKTTGPNVIAMGCCYRANPLTLVLAEREPFVRRMIAAGEAGASQSSWAGQWSDVARADVAAYVNVDSVGGVIDRQLADAPPQGSAALAALQPLWKNPSVSFASANVGNEITVVASATCSDERAAEELSRTLTAVIALGRNSLTQFRQTASVDDSEMGLMMLQAVDAVDSTLTAAQVDQQGAAVELKASTDAAQAMQIVRALAPGVQASRAAGRRTQSTNNLKQLALAMHNYYDMHKHFPPAVVIGPDGKTPHSWRVAILPFLDQQALFDEYRTSEPWDSPHNKKLLDKIPSFFRHPSESAESANASYFALAGPGTIFSGSAGAEFKEIFDGTSNTIMFVEARRDIPWTKPEDIAFDPAQPPADLGGYSENVFVAAFCDGSVRPIAHSVDKTLLRNLIQMNDGQAIELPLP